MQPARGRFARFDLDRQIASTFPAHWKVGPAPKVMVSCGITQDGLSNSKVEPCGVCSLRVKASSVLCVQCGRWIHVRCVGVKRVTSKFSRNCTCRKCGGNVREAVEQEVKLCDEVETVSEFTYLGDRVSAG